MSLKDGTLANLTVLSARHDVKLNIFPFGLPTRLKSTNCNSLSASKRDFFKNHKGKKEDGTSGDSFYLIPLGTFKVRESRESFCWGTCAALDSVIEGTPVGTRRKSCTPITSSVPDANKMAHSPPIP